MITRGWIHAPPRFISFIEFEVVTNFYTRWRKRIREDESDPTGFFEMTMVELLFACIKWPLGNLMKEREKQMNYTSINIIENLKWNENIKTIMHKFDNGVRQLCLRLRALSLWGRLLDLFLESLLVHHLTIADWLLDGSGLVRHDL